MKLKDLVLTSVFFSDWIYIAPSYSTFIFRNETRLLLIMMFISIYLVDNYKTAMVIGLCSGF